MLHQNLPAINHPGSQVFHAFRSVRYQPFPANLVGGGGLVFLRTLQIIAGVHPIRSCTCTVEPSGRGMHSQTNLQYEATLMVDNKYGVFIIYESDDRAQFIQYICAVAAARDFKSSVPDKIQLTFTENNGYALTDICGRRASIGN